MHPDQCIPSRVAEGKTHRYDRISGWCVYGCNVRDDGRIITWSGIVLYSGPEYGPEDQQYLFDLAQKGRQ